MVRGSYDVAGSTSRGLDVANKSFKRSLQMDDKAMSTVMYVVCGREKTLRGILNAQHSEAALLKHSDIF
jgi:hypothetical protein